MTNTDDIDKEIHKAILRVGSFTTDEQQDIDIAELKALIANQVREARLEELERVKRYAGAWFRGDERLVKWIHIKIVDDRIATLKGDK